MVQSSHPNNIDEEADRNADHLPDYTVGGQREVLGIVGLTI
jgi:hypothetical protein